jgi:hypothetical protein
MLEETVIIANEGDVRGLTNGFPLPYDESFGRKLRLVKEFCRAFTATDTKLYAVLNMIFLRVPS